MNRTKNWSRFVSVIALTGIFIAGMSYALEVPKSVNTSKWEKRYWEGFELAKTNSNDKAIKLWEEVVKTCSNDVPTKFEAMLALTKQGWKFAHLYAPQALEMQGITDKEKLDVINAYCSTMGCHPLCWAQYEARYVDLLPDEELTQMKRDYPVYLRKSLVIDPTNAWNHLQLGYAEIQNDNPDKAIPEFRAALKNNFPPEHIENVYLGLADAYFLKNDRQTAIQYLEELQTLGLTKIRSRHSTDTAGLARWALTLLKGTDYDALKLPVYSDAKAFPTPQEANYTEKFVPLTSVKLELGGGLRDEDACIKLLKTKFGRFGIKFEQNAKYTVRINTGTLKAPDRKEGYALAVTLDGAIIQGHDKGGTTWGVVSLIQLIDQAKRTLRLCTINDWPDTARRGHTGVFLQSTEFFLFSKLNTLLTNGAPFDGLKSPLRRFVEEELARQFASFGLDFFRSVRDETMQPKLPLSSDRTFQLHYDHFCKIAAAGGNITFHYDDARYPLHPQDVKTAGNASNLDAKYVTKLYRAIKLKYPNFKLDFDCPFYWGPFLSTSGKSPYPDDRAAYYKSIREELDPEIDVHWTGDRVVGYGKTKEIVKWAQETLGRKPFVWQNRPAPHYARSYITDEIPGWIMWHYDGFFGDIAAYVCNGGLGTVAMTEGDALWNTHSYDSANSIRRAVGNLYGEKMFDILSPGAKALGYFDKYFNCPITREFMEELSALETKIKLAHDCWERARAYNPEVLDLYPNAYTEMLGNFERMVANAKKGVDFEKVFKKQNAMLRELAKQEAGFAPEKGDSCITAFEFFGGVPITPCDDKGRPYLLLRAANTVIHKTSFTFEGTEGKEAELIISGRHEQDKKIPVTCQITLNGRVIHDGPSGFMERADKLASYPLPGKWIKKQNTITFESTSPGDSLHNPTWFNIYYAVIRFIK